MLNFTLGVGVPDVNLLLNILALAALLLGAPRFIRAKQMQTALAEKDRIIETREQDNRALRDHQATLTDELATCQLAARKAAADAATWQARYEEQSKYTAQEALGTIERLIAVGDTEAQRRHVEVMGALENIGTLVGDRRGRTPDSRA